jgi:hypothetical protein
MKRQRAPMKAAGYDPPPPPVFRAPDVRHCACGFDLEYAPRGVTRCYACRNVWDKSGPTTVRLKTSYTFHVRTIEYSYASSCERWDEGYWEGDFCACWQVPHDGLYMTAYEVRKDGKPVWSRSIDKIEYFAGEIARFDLSGCF